MSRSLRKTSASPENRRGNTFWFVAKEKLLTGPFTFEQLLEELASGHLDPGDYCWRQGFQEWRPLCGVEDFGFQAKPYVVRAYPVVPLPSARASSDAPGAKSSPTAQNNKAQVDAHGALGSKTIKVRLETQRRLQVGLWERVAMVVFAVCFAWASTWVALSEVKESFTTLYQRHLVGQILSLGDTSHLEAVSEVVEVSEEVTARDPASLGTSSVTEHFWNFQQLAPVLSAPGLEALQNQAWPMREIVQRPVVSGLREPASSAEWILSSGHSVEWNAPTTGEISLGQATDSVFVQPYELRGTWSADRPKLLHVRTLGFPGL
jgi:hypothetical protein